MNADLEMEELRFESALAKALLSLPSTDRDAQIKRLKTNNSLQKSGIRRLYGVQVRHSKLATPNAVLTGGKLRDRNIPI